MQKKISFILVVLFSVFNFLSVSADEIYTRVDIGTNGISIEVPQNMKVDESLDSIVTKIISDDKSKIYIFNQELEKNVPPIEYINYSNKQIELGKAGVSLVDKDEIAYPNGVKAYIFEYTRPLLKLENDKNHYYEVNLAYEDRVITIWSKTDEAQTLKYKQIVNHMSKSLKLIPNINVPYKAPYKERSVEIKGKNMDIKIGADKLLWGIFHPHETEEKNYIKDLSSIEEKLDWKFEFLMTYSDFRNNIKVDNVKEVYKDGRVMMLTMQPWLNGDRDQNILIPQIINGEFDSYIKKWAQDVKEIKEPVFIRFANEMNGDWDPWCAWFFAKDTDLYIEAWHRVYNIFKEEKADNALFVFNPHDRSYPDFKWNNAHMYYPGADYVEWVGLTGYNNGTSYEGDVWRELDDIYYTNYHEYMKYYSDKPFMITEFSCNEVGGDKAQWIRNGFSHLANMPNIKIAVWFDKVDMEWQYNIDSSKGSVDAFKESLRHPNFSVKSVFDKPKEENNIGEGEIK